MLYLASTTPIELLMTFFQLPQEQLSNINYNIFEALGKWVEDMSALVFMIQGINSYIEKPIGYFTSLQINSQKPQFVEGWRLNIVATQIMA
jgi:hypothetical protein